ncbi:hypothetical protein HK097_010021 [Rhizophlyctis rosea]|uniref:Zn(2)-C6 fungal-type domain-containing protein n=1 Tax=Rhizophlyctis rosea TaxID=64517 RepID=A0AAD5SIV2_9FUNG|nr:hypothetical protein HK097_010021 [Rhizophlyctis rosea]
MSNPHSVSVPSTPPDGTPSNQTNVSVPLPNADPALAQHASTVFKELMAFINLHAQSLVKKANLEEAIAKNASAAPDDHSAQRAEMNRRKDVETTTNALKRYPPSVSKKLTTTTTQICQSLQTTHQTTLHTQTLTTLKSSLQDCASQLQTIRQTNASSKSLLTLIQSHTPIPAPPLDLSQIITTALDPLQTLTSTLTTRANEIVSTVDHLEVKLHTTMVEPVGPIMETFGKCKDDLDVVEKEWNEVAAFREVEESSNNLNALVGKLEQIRDCLNEGDRCFDQVVSGETYAGVERLDMNRQHLLTQACETFLKSHTLGENQSFSEFLEETIVTELTKFTKEEEEDQKIDASDAYETILWDELVPRHEEGFVPDVEALYAEYEALGGGSTETADVDDGGGSGNGTNGVDEPSVGNDAMVGSGHDGGGDVPIHEAEEEDEEEEEEVASGSVLERRNSAAGVLGEERGKKRSREDVELGNDRPSDGVTARVATEESSVPKEAAVGGCLRCVKRGMDCDRGRPHCKVCLRTPAADCRYDVKTGRGEGAISSSQRKRARLGRD